MTSLLELLGALVFWAGLITLATIFALLAVTLAIWTGDRFLHTDGPEALR